MVARPDVNYDRLPEHMREGMRLYIEEGIPPGSFAMAVLENRFLAAFARADEVNTARMRDWAMWLYNEAPSNCHGSPEVVQAWLDKFAVARSEAAIDAAIGSEERQEMIEAQDVGEGEYE